MRHRKSGVKLNRTASHRQAMFRNMVTSLLKHDRIKTTDAKAKELRRWADHIITLAKRGDLHARRLAMAIVREKDVVHQLFENAAQRFGSRNGGYTRIVKIGRRAGDTAPLTLVELISSDGSTPSRSKKRTAEADKAPSAPGSEMPAAQSTPKERQEPADDRAAAPEDVQAVPVDPGPKTVDAEAATGATPPSTRPSDETDKQ